MSNTPSVGRIVHYYPLDTWGEPGPWAAIITKVIDRHTVNLIAFTPIGSAFPEMNIAEGMAKDGTAGHWMWPPRSEA